MPGFLRAFRHITVLSSVIRISYKFHIFIGQKLNNNALHNSQTDGLFTLRVVGIPTLTTSKVILS